MPTLYQQEEVLIVKACEAFEAQNFATKKDAVGHFGANYQRVLNRFRGLQSRANRPPAGQLLSNEDEEGLLI
jgi:hypothetical protein